jgi:hypothetical protein
MRTPGSKRTTMQERKAVDDAWVEECHGKLSLRGSHERTDYLLSLRRRRRGLGWFRLLGDWWSICDPGVLLEGRRPDARRIRLMRILNQATRQQLDAMMTDDERRRLAEMPARIRAFRGCESGDLGGFSFSLCERMARKFPFLTRYRAKVPTLIVADIPKERAVLKLDRKEEEIIACGSISIVEVKSLAGEECPPGAPSGIAETSGG